MLPSCLSSNSPCSVSPVNLPSLYSYQLFPSRCHSEPSGRVMVVGLGGSLWSYSIFVLLPPGCFTSVIQSWPFIFSDTTSECSDFFSPTASASRLPESPAGIITSSNSRPTATTSVNPGTSLKPPEPAAASVLPSGDFSLPPDFPLSASVGFVLLSSGPSLPW